MHTIVIDKQQADFMAACERAEKWIDTARPIILAMFAIEEAGRGLLAAQVNARADLPWNALDTHDVRTYREARGYTDKSRQMLFDMLDGIRSDFLCDEMLPQPKSGASEQEWTDRDEFSDTLDEAVTSVADAIKQIGAEL